MNKTVIGQARSVAFMFAPFCAVCARRNPWPAKSKM